MKLPQPSRNLAAWTHSHSQSSRKVSQKHSILGGVFPSSCQETENTAEVETQEAVKEPVLTETNDLDFALTKKKKKKKKVLNGKVVKSFSFVSATSIH